MVGARDTLRRPGLRPGLPHVNTDNTSLAQWIDAVGQQFSGLTSLRATLDGLRAGGYISATGEFLGVGVGVGTDAPPLGVPNLAVAPKPTGFRASAGIGVVALFWDNPFLTYGNHAVTRVYRFTADEFNNAVQVGTSTGISYVDESPDDSTDETYWYWIRWETTAGASGLGLPSDGLEVEVVADPAIAIQRLSAEILADPLTKALLSPIGTEGDPVIEFVRRYQTIANRVAGRVAEVRSRLSESISDSNLRAITSLMTGTGFASAAALDALTVRVDSEAGKITVNADAITMLEAMIPGLATAAALDILSTQVTQEAGRITVNADAITSLSSMISGFATATALQALTTMVTQQGTEITINAAEITALEAAHGGRTLGPVQNIFEGNDKAAAIVARNAYAAANPAWLAMYDADNDINIELRWGVLYIYQRRLNNAWLDNGEALARAAAVTALNATVIVQETMITALSEMVTVLSAQIGDTSAVAFQELSARVTSTENVDGTTTLASLARWLVKTQVNDLVGGVGLLNDGNTVRFYIQADRFAIYPPGLTDSDDPIVPFIVDGGIVYLDEARIRNGVITSLMAQDAFLTNLTAVHGRLAHARIDQGNIFDLTIGDVIESENYQPGQVGWRITKGGLIDAWGASFRGNIQSGNFTPGPTGSGWRLMFDGTGELDAAYIRGTLSAEHIDSDVINLIPLWRGTARISPIVQSQ